MQQITNNNGKQYEEFIKEYMMNNMQKMGNNSKNKSIYDGIPIHLFMGPK
jgi:hypothetical protein